jgi:hypothetical protein
MNIHTHKKEQGFAFFILIILMVVGIIGGIFGATAIHTVTNPTPSPTPSVSPSPSTSPSTSPSPSSTPHPSPGGTVTTGGDPKGQLYVAMGDSYSSGGGSDRTPSNPNIDVSSYFTSTVYGTNQCYRNKNAAQYLLASALKYSLTDVSCGGANSTNVLSAGQFNEPAQGAYVNSDVQLVTMTMTGNDAGLMWLLQACIMNQLGYVHDCSGNDATYQSAAATMRNEIKNNIPTKINKILSSITSHSHVAKIRWAGYPYILPQPGRPIGTCSSFLSSTEQAAWAEFVLLEDNTIKQTVEAFAKTSSNDIKYVDPLAADSPFMQIDNGQSRDACSTSPNRAINGPTDNAAGGYHPNILGQQYYYQLYKASL